jgi:hypothetical protein
VITKKTECLRYHFVKLNLSPYLLSFPYSAHYFLWFIFSDHKLGRKIFSFPFSSLQWQAGSRQQAVSSGFEPDKSSWGWNWLERWMAVRPWENRFLDINTKDGGKVDEDDVMDGRNGIRPQFRSTNTKSNPPNIHPSVAGHKTGLSVSDGCDSSSTGKSAGLLETSNTQAVKPKSNTNVQNPIEETNSKSGFPRSQSNPKERKSQVDKQAKKRLSLPNNGEFVLFLCMVLM